MISISSYFGKPLVWIKESNVEDNSIPDNSNDYDYQSHSENIVVEHKNINSA